MESESEKVPDKVLPEGIEAAFANKVADFIERYRSALEELAK